MPCDVEQVAAAVRDRAQSTIRTSAPSRDQRRARLLPMKPEAARDHHAPAAVVIEVGGVRHGRSPVQCRAGAPARRIGALMVAPDDKR